MLRDITVHFCHILLNLPNISIFLMNTSGDTDV